MQSSPPRVRLSARLLRPVCRALPPVLAYRLYYRFLFDLEGTGGAFRNVRALYGKARLNVTLHDCVDAHFAFHGTSEWSGMALCRLLVRPGDVVFEIGANLGTETLNLAALVGPRGRILAVEPAQAPFDRLTARVAVNGLRQVTALRRAVAERAGRCILQPGTAKNSGMAYLAPAEGPTPGEAVETTTLDALAEAHGFPDLVWMDIEGYELKALRGGDRVLGKARPLIYTEVDRGHLERAGDSVDALADLLHRYDYLALDPTDWRLDRVDAARLPGGYYHTNWLLLPREKLSRLGRIRWRFLLARLLPRL